MTMNNDMLKGSMDALSVGVVVGTIAQFLPPIAAVLTIIWTIIRIWETETVQKWYSRKSKNGNVS